MVRIIICIAGAIASGKSTFARALADVAPSSVVRSFGDVVRRRALADGLPLDRNSLQEIGLRLIAEGWPAFVDQLLMDLPTEAEVLIVEGVRHIDSVEYLRERFPDVTLRLVYLVADDTTVEQRTAGRGELLNVRDHTVESCLHTMAELADLILRTTTPADMLVARHADFLLDR